MLLEVQLIQLLVLQAVSRQCPYTGSSQYTHGLNLSKFTPVKGSVWLDVVVELRMQYCREMRKQYCKEMRKQYCRDFFNLGIVVFKEF